MKNFCILLFIFLVSSAYAQADEKNAAVLPKTETPVLMTDSLVQPVKKAADFTEGIIPSPESQGFIKTTINGKDIYIKDSNGIFIQYQPN
ncbi:MAG: hypothetical protein H0W61_11765 [Bacteroidetes bacterium]|nr:hypothetical protein [Bacteroidota bacterium]